jgi:hypothetical protein
MKKRIESKIPETYWKTPAGTRIAQAMHSDGWEASDCLTSVMDLLEEGIKNTQDAAIVEELKKARKQVVAAKNAFWKASNLLRETGF